MIRKNRLKIVVVIILLAIVLFAYAHFFANQQNSTGKAMFIHPIAGDVLLTIATTGVVEPQNRLEIKPSIGGRIDKVLVEEGDHVKEGEILAWMSSTERAALIDAARSQGEEVLAYWEEAYKKSPVISPIDGEVIVRSVEPGQTVTTADAVLVLSNRLIINAQFDETDIGKVRRAQAALITLDAYPDVKLEGSVDHIAYESEVVNNVTIYNVDILPKEIPDILRSGMSVSIEVIEEAKRGVLTIPSKAIHYAEEEPFVFVQDNSGEITKRNIKVGSSNEKISEVISGLNLKDTVIIEDNTSLLKRRKTGTNPFMPSRRR